MFIGLSTRRRRRRRRRSLGSSSSSCGSRRRGADVDLHDLPHGRYLA